MHTLRKALGEWAEAVIILGFLVAVITLWNTLCERCPHPRPV